MASRYRLPSEDDDVFNVPEVYLQPLPDPNTPRGTKRQRLLSDEDDVFFRPRARLDSDIVFPRARLPSDSDSSSLCFQQRRHCGIRRNPSEMLQSRNSPSLLLGTSQYTDDTSESSFKTPYTRPPRRKSSGHASSTRYTSEDNIGSRFKEPPRVTRTPFSWVSPNLSGVSPLPLSEQSILDIKQRLFLQFSAAGCVTPASMGFSNFSPLLPGRTSTPVLASPMTSSRTDEYVPSLAQSFLAEEIQPDSGVSSLPTFDGKTSFENYQKNFEEKLLEVMVQILDKVEPNANLVNSESSDVFVDSDFNHREKSPLSLFLSMAATPSSSPGLTMSVSDADNNISDLFYSPSDFATATPNVSAVSPDVPFQIPNTQCKVCHKVLASSYGLKTHMRVHTGERPYVCPYCFRDFSDRSSFRRHKTLHTGKPYSCTDCPKSFVRSNDYKNHRQRYHN